MEEKIIMGGAADDTFHYVLEALPGISVPRACLQARCVLVQVPVEAVERWASGLDVGIEAKLPAGDQRELQILIEKDFACLNGKEEENIDTFPNPLEGTKC